MPFYKRGFLYLARKRAKSVLLLLIFLFVNSMILSTNMILHATERTEAAMQEKAGAKVVCEIMQSTESRCSADHFLPRPKNGEGAAALRRCIPDPVGYQSAGWQWA